MMDELDGAEAWEKEVEKRLSRMKQALKPALLQI